MSNMFNTRFDTGLVPLGVGLKLRTTQRFILSVVDIQHAPKPNNAVSQLR